MTVFISHSSNDKKVAERICATLEERGLACWIAGRDIDPGENYQAAIAKAIRSSRTMILVFTRNANESDEITKELALASKNKIIVIPARVENVTPSDALEYVLANAQWIDLFEDWEREIERLISSIRKKGSAALVKADTAKPVEYPAATSSLSLEAILGSSRSFDQFRTSKTAGDPGTTAKPAGFGPLSSLPDLSDVLGTKSVFADLGRLPTRARKAAQAAPVHHSVAVLSGHIDNVECVAFSPDGKRVVTGSRDNTARLWDAATGKKITDMKGHSNCVRDVAFSVDGQRVMTASWDRSVMLWSGSTGRKLGVLGQHKAEVESVRFWDDRRVVTASRDRTAALWDLNSNQRLAS